MLMLLYGMDDDDGFRNWGYHEPSFKGHLNLELMPSVTLRKELLMLETQFLVDLTYGSLFCSLPELIFWHIPSEAFSKVAHVSEIQAPCVGSINDEKVQFQTQDTGMMEFLVNRPSVKAFFVWHNHGLDWCSPHEKLWLCFSRHTSYGGYGKWPRGARIMEFAWNP